MFSDEVNYNTGRDWNCIVSECECEVTGFSPFSSFWEDPKSACGHTLPSDTRNRYAWSPRVHVKVERRDARRSAEWCKRNHDCKVRSSEWGPGYCILVRNLTPRGGAGKLCSHREEIIHKVNRWIKKDALVYEVVPQQGKRRDSMILHCNLLLPYQHLPLEVPLKVARSWRKNVKQTRQQTKLSKRMTLMRTQRMTGSITYLNSLPRITATGMYWRGHWPVSRLWADESISQTKRGTAKTDAAEEESRKEWFDVWECMVETIT